MSLGRLLTAGKSLIGGQDGTSRYRLNKKMGLPKFVSPRNPFATEIKAEAPPPRPVAPEQNQCAPKAPAVRAVAEGSLQRASLVARLALATRCAAEWLGKANPLARFANSAAAKKSAIPCFTNTPVQSELSLDKVRVVRNDLNDADLEIVPVAPVGGNPDLAKADECEPDGKAWGRLGTRLLGSNHT